MNGHRAVFPQGLEVGDFIQLASHFGDVYFEVTRVIRPEVDEEAGFWMVDYVQYEKYGATPAERWTNSAGPSVRAVVKKEMAVPTLMQKRMRFQAVGGQFDPLYGFAPAGKALRQRGQA